MQFPIVTDPTDRACNVTDPIDSASNVTDPTDRACNSGDIGRLLQEEAEAKAAKRLKGSLKNPAASRLFIFSEAFAQEHCSIFKQAACSSNRADDAISLFFKTDSSKHRMRKYKFLRRKASFPTLTPEQERRRERNRRY